MPSRVDNLLPSRVAKSSPRQVSMTIDFAQCESRANENTFAETLERARTPEPKADSSTADANKAAKSQESRPTKTKSSRRDNEPVNETSTDDVSTGDVASDETAAPTDAAENVENDTAAVDEDAETIVDEDSVEVSSDGADVTDAAMLAAATFTVAPTATDTADTTEDVADETTDDAITQPTVQKRPALLPTEDDEQTEEAKSSDADDAGTRLAQAVIGDAVDAVAGEDVEGDADGIPALSADDSDDAVTSIKPATDPRAADDAEAPGEETTAPVAEKRPVLKEVGRDEKKQDADVPDKSAIAQPVAEKGAEHVKPATTIDAKTDAVAAPVAAAKTTHTTPAAPAPVQTPQPRLQEFAENNHDTIVTSLRSQAFAKGGTMEIRLDPPELGALQVSVKMQDGVITASFQTNNDEATRLLSHSLGQLKHVLESSGVSVDKLQVQQSPKSDHDGNANDGRNHAQNEDASARQEQQRKEMIKRMWRKLAGTSDPLDLVA